MTATYSSPTLNPLVTAYVRAMNCHDTAALTECFTFDAIVQDEGKSHKGHEAIAAWAKEAFEAYRPQLDIKHVGMSDHHAVISGIVSGSFEGSPVELHHFLETQEGKIHFLKIT